MDKAILISFLLFVFVAVQAQTTDNTFVVKKAEAADSLSLYGIYIADIDIKGQSGFKLYLKFIEPGKYELFIGGADEARSLASSAKSSQWHHTGLYKVENDTVTFAYRTEMDDDFTVLNRDMLVPKGTLVVCTATIHPDKSLTLTREITVNGRPKLIMSVIMRKQGG
jgi:uncharacterized membrane protein